MYVPLTPTDISDSFAVVKHGGDGSQPILRGGGGGGGLEGVKRPSTAAGSAVVKKLWSLGPLYPPRPRYEKVWDFGQSRYLKISYPF